MADQTDTLVLKILSISQPHSGSDSGDESYNGGSGWSADRERATGSSSGIKLDQRSYVQVEEELDLHAGQSYSGAKNSKATLINDVGWGYDCESQQDSSSKMAGD